MKKKLILKTIPLISLGIVLAAAGLCGCAADTDPGSTSNESVSEVAGSSTAGAVNASGGTISMNDQPQNATLLALDRIFNPIQSAYAAACSTLSAGACSGSVGTLSYTGCSFGSSLATWSGSMILTWTLGACPGVTTGNTFTRTYGVGTNRTGANGVVVTIDTAGTSGWSVVNSGGGTTVAVSGGSRTVTINGVHYVATKAYTTLKGVAKTATVWDHTVSSGAVTYTGATFPAGGTLSGGPILVQHNLAKYAGLSTLTNLGFTAGCCHPTSGTISTTLYGTLTGTETLTYGACGTATYTAAAAGSTPTTITLSHCL